MSNPSTTAKDLIGDIAPKLAQLTDRVLFDDVWSRPELSRRDRSLITVAALIALNRPEQLRFHLGYALENGANPAELIEAITQAVAIGIAGLITWLMAKPKVNAFLTQLGLGATPSRAV